MEKEEFESLLEEHKKVIERFIHYKIRSEFDAEDVLQKTFLAAYQGYGAIKKDDMFKAWLLGIAKHKCNDYFRKKK